MTAAVETAMTQTKKKKKNIAIGFGVIALGSLALNLAACGVNGSSAEGSSEIGHVSHAVTSPPPTQTATAPATVTASASATATADASSPADGGDAGGDGGASTVGKVFVVPRLRCACWGPNNPEFGDIAEVSGFSVCAASVEACDSRDLTPNARDIACRAVCVDQGKKNGRNYNTGMETSQFEYELGNRTRPSCTAVDPELRCALPR